MNVPTGNETRVLQGHASKEGPWLLHAKDARRYDPAPLQLRGSEGLLEVSNAQGMSAVTRARASSPMKLLVPRTKSAVARVSVGTYGGGLLAGDETTLRAHLREGAQAIITTQSSTKVFKSIDGRTTRQTLSAHLEPGSIAAFVPDPIACFADARYTQHQRFDVTGDATLVVLDWFTSGRRARGEVWAFEHYSSRQQVFVDGRRIIEDAVRLDRHDGDIASRFRGGRYHCHALLIVVGEKMQKAVDDLHSLASGRGTHRSKAQENFWVVANPVPHGVVLRMVGEETEAVARFLAREVEPRLDLFEAKFWRRKF